MTDSPLLTILHISDMHFSKRRQREQALVVEALIADLKVTCIGHRRPDLILFTGDLVYAAGLDRHDDAYDFMLESVSKTAGCSDERVFIVPGNHDVEWAGIDRFTSELHTWRALVGSETETEVFNELYVEGAFDPAVNAKFANYLDLERYLRGSDRSGIRKFKSTFATVDHIAPLNVDVVTFNTAVLSAGGHKSFQRDEQLLVVPEYAVLEVEKYLSPGALKVFLTHHPLTMLSEQSARILEGEINKHAHIHLYGHMHDPQPRSIIGLRGSVLTNQAGALFVSRKSYYAGYSLLTVDTEKQFAELVIRSYFKDRNSFDDGIDVIEGGRWWSSQDARQFFRTIASPIDEQKLRDHLASEAFSALRQREEMAGGTGDLHDKFVPPPLRRTFMQEMSGDSAKIEIDSAVTFEELKESQSNLVLYAKPEYGRTTILREIRYTSLSEAQTVRYPRLPVLIDFKDVGTNVSSMLRKVRGGADLLPSGYQIEGMLALGHALVMIDDVEFQDTKRMRVLREFVALYPKSQYIFSSQYNSVTKFGARVDPEMPISFDFVEIREFRRNDMRQMLKRDERCTDVEVWLDRIQNEFREINLPFTAANGSILIEILSEKYNFSPINRAVLMEQFVDMTLRKAAIEQSRRETFDYTNKTDLLSYVASWMAKCEQYVHTMEDVRGAIKSYIDTRGLKVSIQSLMEEFFAARIFVARPDDSVSFRYRGVLEYFIALRMTNDREFREWVMEEDRYLQFSTEIQYYAGKLRNDSELVHLVAARHKAIMETALSDVTEADLYELERLKLPRENDGDRDDDDDYQLFARPLSQEERDAELEMDTDEDGDNQEVVRERVIDVTEKVTPSMLLYSGLIKNMELISDADKRVHLRSIWDGWAQAFVSALRVAPRLARERRIRINGALYEVRAPQGLGHTKLLRQMMLLLPHVFIRMISGSLGTEKLEYQLLKSDSHGDATHPKVLDFLRVGVISDLRLSDTPKAIGELAEELRDNPYLLWCLIVHVSELRRLDRVTQEHFLRLENILATAIADLKGGSPAAREREASRQIARLSRDRLVVKLKKDKEVSKRDGSTVVVR